MKASMASLQKLLKWLRWKNKCWCSLIAKESMLHNKNKQQKNFVKRKAHDTFELKKKKKSTKRESFNFNL